MLKINQLSHAVADRFLFKNLSLVISSQKTGLVGPNGVGKSTLARMIAKQIQPDSGSVTSSGGVRYLSQFEERVDQTLAEYLVDIWEDMSPEVLALVQDLDLERKLSDLSGGEWMRARLARNFVASGDFLILDEPTNNLDLKGRAEIYHFVRTTNASLLVISHDRELLRQMDQILELSNQGLTSYGGNFDFYWQERERERERAGAKLESAKKESHKKTAERVEKLERQEKRMREGKRKAPDAGIPKIILGAMKRQAQNSHAKLKIQEDHFVDEAQLQQQEAWKSQKLDPFLRLDFAAAAAPASKLLYLVKGLQFRFANSAQPLWKKAVDFQLKGSERLRILGKNGSGKSTLLKLLQKEELGILSGEIQAYARVAYLDQGYGLLDPKLSVLENILQSGTKDPVEVRNELAFYGFRGEQANQVVASLSGGERLKAALAKLFLGGPLPEVLILDEPTNNLDLQSVELLSKALKHFRGALIVISHDQDFVSDIGITQELELS